MDGGIKLLEVDKDILRSKYPVDLHRRLATLFKYDKLFRFHRTRLSKFLTENGLNGYGRIRLYQLLGPPVLCKRQHRVLQELLDLGLVTKEHYELILQRNVYRKINRAVLDSYGHPYRNDQVKGLD